MRRRQERPPILSTPTGLACTVALAVMMLWAFASTHSLEEQLTRKNQLQQVLEREQRTEASRSPSGVPQPARAHLAAQHPGVSYSNPSLLREPTAGHAAPETKAEHSSGASGASYAPPVHWASMFASLATHITNHQVSSRIVCKSSLA